MIHKRKYQLNLSDFWNNFWIGSSWQPSRNTIVQRIRQADFWNSNDPWLTRIVEELENADNYETFLYHWDTFYDWADNHDVWVNTLGIEG